MHRTQLYADPKGRFLHDLILDSCRRFPQRTAIVDTSLPVLRRCTYAEYGELVEGFARGLVACGLQPGEVVGIYLPNSWEFCAVYHAATLAGAIPTPLNPTYREREVRYQLENSGAVMLITDGALISSIDLSGVAALRRVFFTRERGSSSAEPVTGLLHPSSAPFPVPVDGPERTLAVLPYSSGTTGLPKGVMLSHSNLVVNIFQLLAAGPFVPEETALCFLPLYHIYGLNVVLNSVLALGGTVVLMPRFELSASLQLIASEPITFVPVVPPILSALTHAAEQGLFPRQHCLRWIKCGAAPLPPQLPRRFTALTGIKVVQAYGMTEASPVTHIGFFEGPLYRPESIGVPVALTECILTGGSSEFAGEPSSFGENTGELVMKGPQFMLGYWNAPQATAETFRPLPVGIPIATAVLGASSVAHPASNPSASAVDTAVPQASGASGPPEPQWYHSGDVARVDADGLFYIVDRHKEMIKYKGFAVAPAEVEAMLLENSAVRDCGVIGQFDDAAGEVPVAFIVLREGFGPSRQLGLEMRAWLGERMSRYKQPREIRFVDSIPRTPSGKILRRELRKLL